MSPAGEREASATKPGEREAPARPAPATDKSFEEYPLTRIEYIQAIVHLYRGELSRSNAWRARLDTTTNWAIGATAALLSYSFGDPTHSHVVLLFGTALVLLLLGYEARRFRFFDVWRARVRMIEENFYGPILRRDLVSPKQSWGRLVARDLLAPEFKISILQAFRARLARNYLSILSLLVFAWGAKVAMMRRALGLETLQEAIEAGMGDAFPWWVPFGYLVGLVVVLVAILLLVRSPASTDEAYWPRPEEQDRVSPLDV
ncbi:MAG: DUF2270 domain-containing protein [Planctomycetes bacterium]|nr:DUF2270 domain-containing protein [Planctomycetota bacterium]